MCTQRSPDIIFSIRYLKNETYYDQRDSSFIVWSNGVEHLPVIWYLVSELFTDKLFIASILCARSNLVFFFCFGDFTVCCIDIIEGYVLC